MLAGYWGLSEAQAKTWWHALSKAKWSVARQWRQQVVLFDQGIAPALATPQAVDAVARFLDTTASPARVVAVLEALAQERLLSRRDSTGIEEKMLMQVTSEGRWK